MILRVDPKIFKLKISKKSKHHLHLQINFFNSLQEMNPESLGPSFGISIS